MSRSRNAVRVRIATMAAAATTLVLAGATVPAHATGLKNCIETGGAAPCFELVWADGAQVTMTFANLDYPSTTGAPTNPFYVTAPQTATPQGYAPPFLHDHVIGAVPPSGHGATNVHWRGFLVLCSALGISSGGCVPTMTSPAEGAPPLPMATTVNGQPLTSVAPIEAPANAGLIVLADSGAVFIGAVSASR